MVKLKTNFPKSIVALIALARTVKSSIANSAYFAVLSAEFAAAVAQLGTDIEKLQKAQDDVTFGGTQRTSYRNQVAAELVTCLKNVVRHTELHANGDIAILRASGFGLVDPLAKKWKIPEQLPSLFVSLSPAEEPGTLVATAVPVPYAVKYEAHLSQGDPTVPENWNHFGFYKHPIMHLSGFTAGQNYNLRFRLICSKGEGPWSPTHSFISN